MRIQTKGITSITKVGTLIKEVVNTVKEKANISKDVKFKIEDLSCDIVFMVDGKEQKMTVEHGGVPEIFTVAIKLDNKGNIEVARDNIRESFMDEYIRQEMTGVKKEYEEIESMFNDADLKILQEQRVGEVLEMTLENIHTGEHLVRYFKDDKLVGELLLKA